MQKQRSRFTNSSPTSHFHWRKVQVFYKAAFRFLRIKREIQIFGASKLVYSVAVPLTQYSDSREIANHWILLPSNRVLTAWHYLMYFVLLWTVLVGTFSLCFLTDADAQGVRLEELLLVLCPLDIVVTFLSAYKDNARQVVTNPLSVARHYLHSWLVLDCLASAGALLPAFSLVLPSTFCAFLAYGIHLARVAKLIKHSQQFKRMRFLKHALGPISLRILRLLGLHLMITHVLGCLWYLLTRWEEFQIDSWAVRYGYMDKSPLESYIASIYFIWTTLATVGTGDIVAFSQKERVFTVVLMAFGAGFLSYTISTVSVLLNNSEASDLTRKLEGARDLAYVMSLKNELVQEVLGHLRYTGKHESRNWQQELGNLPLFLASELSLFMHHQLVSEVSFFQDKEPLFISEVFSLLQVFSLEENKIVYRKDSFPSEVYFLRKGRVDLIQQEIAFVTYVQGSYFGELEILWRTLRTSTARTQCSAELLALPREHFLRVLNKYPSVREEMLEIAHIRQARNTALLKSAPGDVALSHDSRKLSRKFSMRHLKQRENYRVNWRRVDTMERSLRSRWSSGLKHSNSIELISAGQTFLQSESQARRNIIRRKRRSVLVLSETTSEEQLMQNRRAMDYLALLREQFNSLEEMLQLVEKEHTNLRSVCATLCE